MAVEHLTAAVELRQLGSLRGVLSAQKRRDRG